VLARNIAGEASSTCQVMVKGLPPTTSDSEQLSDIDGVAKANVKKPEVKVQLRNVDCLEGNLIRLDCLIVGTPEPEVIWYHDGKPVKVMGL